jgi:hypothetical protein
MKSQKIYNKKCMYDGADFETENPRAKYCCASHKTLAYLQRKNNNANVKSDRQSSNTISNRQNNSTSNDLNFKIDRQTNVKVGEPKDAEFDSWNKGKPEIDFPSPFSRGDEKAVQKENLIVKNDLTIKFSQLETENKSFKSTIKKFKDELWLKDEQYEELFKDFEAKEMNYLKRISAMSKELTMFKIHTLCIKAHYNHSDLIEFEKIKALWPSIKMEEPAKLIIDEFILTRNGGSKEFIVKFKT